MCFHLSYQTNLERKYSESTLLITVNGMTDVDGREKKQEIDFVYFRLKPVLE